MAANCDRIANTRKKKLPSMDRLIEQGKNILGKGKKRRRLLHYEYSTDPSTGRRNCKNTYNSKYYNHEDTGISSNLEEYSGNMFQVPEVSPLIQLDCESDVDVSRNFPE
ncbi:Hypothetical predicted protein, partial [Paramuricea clavata]